MLLSDCCQVKLNEHRETNGMLGYGYYSWIVSFSCSKCGAKFSIEEITNKTKVPTLNPSLKV